MAVYTINYPNRTLTIHKNSCNRIPKESNNSACGCIKTGKNGNQEWLCEEHINIKDINSFMKNRFWGILVCNQCF